MNPFSDNPEETAAGFGEAELIRRVAAWLDGVNPPPPEGIGDDCSVYRANGDLPQLITTDPVLLGCHFDTAAAPEDAGAKLLKRNISDIAAMGGRPLLAVISLVLPPRTRMAWLQRFFEGLCEVARTYSIRVTGGDVTRSDSLLGGFLTLVGDVPSGRALTRSGARPGDRLFVTGALGGSPAGHHLHFEPRVREGRWLAGKNAVRSMIDVSDGLAKDLPALLPEGSRAELYWERLPVREAARQKARETGKTPWLYALCDGEDYELLFSLDRDVDPEAFMREWRAAFSCPLTPIGGIVLQEPGAGPLPPFIAVPPEYPELAELHGYEHLRP